MSNDMLIIGSIIAIFIVIGFVLPFASAEFDSETPNFNSTTMQDEFGQEVTVDSKVSAIDVFASIFKMFFWTFGALPAWLEIIIFIPLRIILVLTVARNVWIGGGS